jgi:signal transduction histidine kinase
MVSCRPVRALNNRRLDRWPSHLVIGIAMVTPVIIIAAVSYHQSMHDLTALTLSRRHAVAALAATTIEEKFARMLALGVSLATRVHFQQLVEAGQWQEAIAILQRIPDDFPGIDRVFLTDPGGTLMADTPVISGVRGLNFAQRDWYQGVSRHWRPYLSEVYRRAAAPPFNVIAVAIPIPLGVDSIAGILVLQVRLQSLLAWIETLELEPTGVIYLVDRRGRLAAHPQVAPEASIQDVSHVPAVQKALQGEQGVELMRHPTAQDEYVAAYAPVPGYGWGVIAEQPARAAFAARNAQLRRLLWAFGLVALASGTGAYWLIHTLSERRQTAQQINALNAELQRWTADLEIANKELEAFNYAASHDLRAPLARIDGFSQILMEEYVDTLDAQGRDYLQRIRNATQSMADLIDALLSLSHAARAELRRAPVDLGAIARTIVTDLRSQEPARSVAVIIADDLMAEGDGALLHIALANLFSNAWKFTTRTDQARIEFGHTRQPDGTAVFFVRDNGIGFEMAAAEQLFEPFRRFHRSTEFPGTGVGLATVRRIIERHGGRIWAEGGEGQGATFSFTL